jgi:hypothetical protein
MNNNIRDKIERFKIKAEGFLKEDIKAFIIDINQTWYSCNIISMNNLSCLICNFEGDDIGITQKIYFSDIIRLEEYKKKEMNK